MALLVVTILAAIPKICIGFDRDEAYIVTMGIRLFQGNRIFDDMWELHMTSAWPAFLGLYVFHGVTGSFEGAVIFLRILSTIVQFGVAWLTYWILHRYEGQDAAVLAGVFVANFLPRATQNLEYGLLEMLFVLVALLLVYDECMKLKQGQNMCILKILLAGISYALGVLAYPTILISFPAVIIAMLFLQKKGTSRWKMPLLFAAACAVCAILFFGYILSYLSLTEFLANLQGILSDGTHADSIKTATYLVQIVELGKRLVMIAAGACVCFLCFYKWEKNKELFWYCLILSGALIFIGFNVTGIRPSGAIGLQVRYLLAGMLAAGFAVKMRDKEIAGLFLVPGFCIYAGAMIGSNMGFEENASFLYLSVLAAILLMVRLAKEKGRRFYGMGIFCIVTFLCSILYGKGCLVRITGTGPANIAEQRVQMQEGILRGVYVYPKDAEKYAEKEKEMRAFSDAKDTVLYLGADAICNTFVSGSFTSATCISTPAYNEEWILYYENEKHPRPTVVFLDKDLLGTFEAFEETEFGRYLVETYAITEADVVEEEMFYIFSL